jgi:hypothetical protein
MYNQSFARIPSTNATNSNVSSTPFDRLQQYTATQIENATNSEATLTPFDRLQQYTTTAIGPSVTVGRTVSSNPSSSPTKNEFLCGLCPDSRFPLAHGRIYDHGMITSTCLELDFRLTSAKSSQECLAVLDSIGYDIDIWSFCECPGVDSPKLCQLCPGAQEGGSFPKKIVDGLHCTEWAHYAANALNGEYCSELIESVGTVGTCCPPGVLHDRIP